jgi:hypothetical protein
MSSITSTINKSVSNSIINTIQQYQSSVSQSQILEVDCDDKTLEIISRYNLKCVSTLNNLKIPKAYILKYCKPVIECKASNVSMGSSINIQDITKQTSVIESKIQTSIENDVQQTLKQFSNELTDFFISSKNNLLLKNLSTNVSTNITSVLQDIQNDVNSTQKITIDNYSSNNIESSILFESVNKIILSNSDIQNSIFELSNSISQTINNNNSNSLASWATTLGSISISVVVILFLIIGIIKRPNTRQFIFMVAPYVLLLIFATVTVLAQYITKPLYIMNDKFPEKIDTLKLLGYSFIYIFIFAIVEVLYFRYIKK